MIITHATADNNIKYAYLNIFPDQFKPEKEKLENSNWIKNSMDFFSTKAYAQYRKNKKGFVRNYNLVKGILDKTDYYEEPEIQDFMTTLTNKLDLPAYVKHYPIVNPPLNTMIGELGNMPDIWKAKAFDDLSKSEEFAFRTNLLTKYTTQLIQEGLKTSAAQEGQEISDEDTQKLTAAKVQEQITDYTSTVERWANKILECQKVDFSMREKSEEAFRDLLIAGREYFLIDEDNSKLGFNIEVVNPAYVSVLSTPDKKYTSDPSDRAQGAHAVSVVQVMEISEIIEKFPKLSKEEIDHLREGLENFGIMDARESNLGTSKSGPDTVEYDTYNRLLMQERMMIESDMTDPGTDDNFGNLFSLTSGVSAFGYKYVVIRSYWQSKQLIGELTYTDEMGNTQVTIVDEHYVDKSMPTQISLKWGYRNQWYKGYKIGPDVFHVEPFKLFNYCPLFGLIFESKNTEVRSLIDLLKPFQILYNVCMNQLFSLLKKEKGNLGVINIRRIPRTKDGDAQDDLDMWELDAQERGIIFDDDSPENMKAPTSNTSVARNIDLTRTNEIQSRYTLAIQLKNEAWELVGITKQRLGGSSGATETATATNTGISQSYTQTKPWFLSHIYLMNQVYQGIVDSALYMESKNPTSTISYITSQGDAAFIEVSQEDLEMRKMKVFIASTPEDSQQLAELKQLAQPLLQNGGSFSDVIELYSTNSIRERKRVFRVLREKQEAQQQQAAAQKQQELDQQQQQFQAAAEEAKQQHQIDVETENYNKELDRINKKEVALINQVGKNPLAEIDNNHDGIPDNLQNANLQVVKDRDERDHTVKLLQIQQKDRDLEARQEMEKSRLQAEKEKAANDLKIKKLEIKSKPKPTKKGK